MICLRRAFPLLIVLLVILSQFVPCASARKTYLHHAIGDTISVDEAVTYQLFRDYPQFQQAWITYGEYTAYRRVIVRYGDPVVVREHVFPDELLDYLPDALNAAVGSDTSATSTTRRPVSLQLKRGDELNGHIIGWTGSRIVFQLPYGRLEVPIDEIKQIDKVDKGLVVEDRYWFEDPNRNRLLVFPTARSLPAGSGQVGMHEVLLPLIRVGLPWRISVGGGVMPFSTTQHGLLYALGKITVYEDDRFALAAGGMGSWTNVFSRSTTEYSSLYGLATYGTSRAAVTAGVASTYDDNRELEEDPFLILGGTFRANEHTALITEGWFFQGGEAWYGSVGVRMFGSFFAADLAVAWEAREGKESPVIPLINLVLSF